MSANADRTQFNLPAELQQQLLDDWELVTKEYRLVPLPRQVSVSKILQVWLSTRRNDDLASHETADGLKEYFNAALPTMLLYKFERAQYNNLKPQVPADVYGAEHLTRLLLKIPFMLEATHTDPAYMKRVAEKLDDLSRFLVDNGRILFVQEYSKPDSSYFESATHQTDQEEPRPSLPTAR